jgi:lactoylglutathione lyase
MHISKLTPNLIVRNVKQSLNFYREVLGLEKAIGVPDESPYVFASVSNGAIEIFFNDQKTVAAEYPKLPSTSAQASPFTLKWTTCKRCWTRRRRQTQRFRCQ